MKLLTLTLAILTLFLSGCDTYQKSVGSREIGVEGQFDKTTGDASGRVNYKVTYR